MLLANAKRVHVILSNTSVGDDKKWDTRNSAVRQRLIKANVDIQHRMFNNSTHIGHNKFVVHVSPQGGSRSVLTGSTNWTSTGLAGQTNNALLVEDDTVAAAFLDYWQRLKDDALILPNPLELAMKDNQQSLGFRKSNEIAVEVPMQNGARIELWFSPNQPERRKPQSKTKPTPVPPDLSRVYQRMRMAKDIILFLAFYPRSGSAKDVMLW
jgi:phosphatidylserine/phosphatidylglycerophosphate/cardiolipin synthase-like enzyme